MDEHKEKDLLRDRVFGISEMKELKDQGVEPC